MPWTPKCATLSGFIKPVCSAQAKDHSVDQYALDLFESEIICQAITSLRVRVLTWKISKAWHQQLSVYNILLYAVIYKSVLFLWDEAHSIRKLGQSWNREKHTCKSNIYIAGQKKVIARLDRQFWFEAKPAIKGPCHCSGIFMLLYLFPYLQGKWLGSHSRKAPVAHLYIHTL